MERIKRSRYLACAAFALAIVLVAGLTVRSNLIVSSSVITVPDDYLTIQEAINAANEGDTVFVKAGQYNESITVDRSLNLMGEGRETTIIDGKKSMTVILVQANRVKISNFTIQNSLTYINAVYQIAKGGPAGGVALNQSVGTVVTNNTIQGCVSGVTICAGSRDNIISDNEIARGDVLGPTFTVWGVAANFLEPSFINSTISNDNISGVYWGIFFRNVKGNFVEGNHIGRVTDMGIWLENSSGNTFLNNTILNCTRGVYISESGDNILRSNVLFNNTYSFGVVSSDLSGYINDIDISNTVDGNPLYYLINQADLDINPRTWPEIGFLGLINSKNIKLWRLSLIGNVEGALMVQTSNCEISECNFPNNEYGIFLWNCSDDAIFGNTMTSSHTGMQMIKCERNVIRGNTFLKNGKGLYIEGSKDNTFHRNNFLNNGEQVSRGDDLPNTWDDGNSFPGPFPCPICGKPRIVGNYWNDYTGDDNGVHSQAHNCPGDGVGDIALPHQELDCYPLMRPWVPVFGDLDYNGIVNIVDMYKLARNFYKTSP